MKPSHQVNTEKGTGQVIREQYLKDIQNSVYEEPDLNYHKEISESLIENINPDKTIDVLDVGVGRGYSLRKFIEKGFNVTGITLSQKEYRDFQDEGIDVKFMDMADLKFDDESFDLVWCRHALEHSVMPFIALREFYRVLRRGKLLFIEVPSDNVFHIENPNHYSLFSDHAWQALFHKAKFEVISRVQTRVVYKDWADIYWQFWLRKNV